MRFEKQIPEGPYARQTPGIIKALCLVLVFLFFFAAFQGIQMQYRMHRYEAELRRTQGMMSEYRELVIGAASRESLEDLMKSLNYATDILARQQDQIDLLIMNKKKWGD